MKETETTTYSQDELNKIAKKVRKNTRHFNRKQTLERARKLLETGQISINSSGDFVIRPEVLTYNFVLVDKS